MEVLYRDEDDLYYGDLSFLNKSDGGSTAHFRSISGPSKIELSLKGAILHSISMLRIQFDHKGQIYTFYPISTADQLGWLETNYRVGGWDKKVKKDKENG